MCLAVPGKIISIKDSKGIIEIGNMQREVYMQLVPNAKVGQYVLVHAGCAIEIVDEEEAKVTLGILKELSENEIY